LRRGQSATGRFRARKSRHEHAADRDSAAVAALSGLHAPVFRLVPTQRGRVADHVVAQQLRHDDGGTLVRELYGHPDAAIARERIRAAFRESAAITALPTTNHAGRAA
jgi:hypothetical protein